MSNIIAKSRFVFDRKKQATNNKEALIQVEVLYESKRKFIGTGVKVCLNQWDDCHHVKNRLDAIELNGRIDAVKSEVDQAILQLFKDGTPFTFDRLERQLHAKNENVKNILFVEWVRNAIQERKDLQESTKKSQRKIINLLKEFGRIKYFNELTPANVHLLDKWLHDKGLKQSTCWSYHKVMKIYIHEAMRLELIDRDPYSGFRISKGVCAEERFLTSEEVTRIEQSEMPNESLTKVKDLFLFQCYTGLSYSDLMEIDISDIRQEGGINYIKGKRKKTGVVYTFALVPMAMDILEKYKGKLPRYSNYQYNMRLKIVADYAGIDKPIASHWGRRTCATMLLNKGMGIEVVSKVLGHADIKVTQESYAKLIDKTVIRQFSDVFGL